MIEESSLKDIIKDLGNNPVSREDLERLSEDYNVDLEFEEGGLFGTFAKLSSPYMEKPYYFKKLNGLFYVEE